MYVFFRVLAGLLGVCLLLLFAVMCTDGPPEKAAAQAAFWGLIFAVYGIFGWTPKALREPVFGRKKPAGAVEQDSASRPIE